MPPADSRRPGRRCRTNPPPRKRSDSLRRQRRKSDSWDAPHAPTTARSRSTGAGPTSRSDSRVRGAPCGPRTRNGTTTTYSWTASPMERSPQRDRRRPSCWPRDSPTVCTPYSYRNEPRANRDARRSSLSVPTGPCSMRPRPRAGTSSSSATRTPADTARRANPRRSPSRPRPRTATWRGAASSHATSTQTTRSSHTPGRESYATGATRRRSPTAPCASA